MRQVFWRQCNSVIVATMVPLWAYLVSKAPGDLTFLVQPILAFDFHPPTSRAKIAYLCCRRAFLAPTKMEFGIFLG